MIATCEYDTQRDSILRDQIVIGVADNKTREKLLFDPQLTLAKAIDILRACETSSSTAELMSAEAINRLTLDKFKSGKPALSKSGHGGDRRSSTEVNKSEQDDKFRPSRTPTLITSCKWCGGSHFKGRCPAFGKQCSKCGKSNHFEKVCNSENVASLDEYVINSLSGQQQSQWSVDLLIAGYTVPFKVDTVASCNVIPLSCFDKFGHTKKLLPGPRVRTYNGQSLHVLGQQDVAVFFNSKRFQIRVIVIKEDNAPILGLPSCCELGLVHVPQLKVNEIVVDSSSPNLPVCVFIGIGKLPIEHEIKLKDSCVPVVRPPRRIPFKIRDLVKKKLDDMEQLKLICKVTEPTDWVNPMLAVQKAGGDVRICLDPLDLNKVIKRQHYPVPTAQELFARIGKVFLNTRRNVGVSANFPVGRVQFCYHLRHSIWTISFSSSAIRYLLGPRGLSADDDTVVWRPQR